MHPNSTPHNHAGFSLFEMLVATTVMLIVTASIVSLLRSSLSVATATYELTEAQENMRVAHEFITRDLLSAGDGLKSMTTIPVSEDFVENYLTTNPIEAVGGIVNLGILTTDNDVAVDHVVWGPDGVDEITDPVVKIRSSPVRSDRHTIMEIDSAFTPISLVPATIKTEGTEVTILDGDVGRFTIGEVYFLTSSMGGTFGTLTNIVVDGAATVNSTLEFKTGDKLDINLAGTAHGFWTISDSGTLATSLQRMKIIHYYIDTTGRLVRRVFGVKGAAFRDSAIAEHVVSVQFLYSLGPDDLGNVRQPVAQFTNSAEQIAVRQVGVTITVETPHPIANGSSPQLSSSATTSVRNMQFREALAPEAPTPTP